MTLTVDAVIHRGAFSLTTHLEVGTNEVVALLGASGAGKTTLLRAIAGLTPLTEGRISLGATALDDVSHSIHMAPEQRNIGMVFQDYRLFPHLSVLDNIAFGLRANGLKRKAAMATSQNWLDRFAMSDFGARLPSELSGGQAQRIALIRALAIEPQLLLLDEPLSSLDSETRSAVRAELGELFQQLNTPVLIVTHQIEDAGLLSTRSVLVANGKLSWSTPV